MPLNARGHHVPPTTHATGCHRMPPDDGTELWHMEWCGQGHVTAGGGGGGAGVGGRGGEGRRPLGEAAEGTHESTPDATAVRCHRDATGGIGCHWIFSSTFDMRSHCLPCLLVLRRLTPPPATANLSFTPPPPLMLHLMPPDATQCHPMSSGTGSGQRHVIN